MLGRAGWGSGGQCQGGAQLECKVWTRHEWPHSRSQPSYATTASPRGGDKQLWRAAGDSLLVCPSLSPEAALDGRKAQVSEAVASAPAARCDLSQWAPAQRFGHSINLPSSAALTTARQP